MASGRRGQSLGKAALARTTRIGDGTITAVDSRVSPMAQILGIVFDASNNIINSAVTDAVSANTINIADLETSLATLELALANYATHTHNYSDGTIADTDLGGSAQIDTTRTTTGVN